MGQTSIWTEPILTDFDACIANSMSAADTADKLNRKHGLSLTRNAVLGKAFRLGKAFKSVPMPKRAARPKRVRLIGIGNNMPKLVRERAPIDKVEPILDQLIDPSQRKRLLQLEEGHCRWPVGDPAKPNFYFCGGQRVGEVPYCLPYCAYHSRVAYQPRRRAG